MSDQRTKPFKVGWNANLVAPFNRAVDTNDENGNDAIGTATDPQQREEMAAELSLINHAKEDNPQEASTPPDGPLPLVVSAPLNDRITKSPTKVGWKQRKQGRKARVAELEVEMRSIERFLPLSQYETTIRRRAVRKRGEALIKAESPPPRRGLFGTSMSAHSRKNLEEEEDLDDVYDEDFGDVSLGMKLNIIGGKVIVQGVNPLADGRASPAQLTGVIQRGDVLLSIDERSLVNMPIDLLLDGLKPLSSPQPSGAYKRVLNLRLAIGEGLILLEKNEKQASKNAGSEMFSLANFMPPSLPMVDQLSGQPLFVEETIQKYDTKPLATLELPQAVTGVPLDNNAIEQDGLSLDAHMSRNLADRRHDEQQKYISEFFAWNDANSELLKPRTSIIGHVEDAMDKGYQSKTEILEKGLQVMKGAKAVSYSMEDIDKGKDLRSFKAWSTTLSIRSRASTRRRFVFDVASMVGSSIVEVDSDIASGESSAHGELDGLNPDELLIQLAAHDEIWRKQVIEAIKQSTKAMEDEKDDDITDAQMPPDLDLGSLFLGEKVQQLFKKDKKSYALPPEEVTTVLFDLVTNLASTTPDEISVKGGFNMNPQTSLVPFEKQKKNVDHDNLLAFKFVIGDVFPAWLESFRALPWEERRVLWPHTRASGIESHAGTSFALSIDDGLTLDSGSTGHPSSPIRKRKKDLRETIEDMELDTESRGETCFLLTFFFTQVILPKLIGSADLESGDDEIKSALTFVDRFGSYLKLPMCLAYAAYVRSEEIILKLLALAKHDLRHHEAMKETARMNSLVLYEPTMVSAIMTHLQIIASEHKTEVRIHVIQLCVSSYPDVRPWQVRKACSGDKETQQDLALAELYYQYLCLLLHPFEGSESAKQDRELVKEWCELSVEPMRETQNYSGVLPKSLARLENFYRIAKRSSPDHRLYHRDLVMLLDVSRKCNEYDLVLDLAEEMLEQCISAGRDETISTILYHLRIVGEKSLFLDNGNEQIIADRMMKIIELVEKIASMQQSGVVVAKELYEFLRKCSISVENVSKKERIMMTMFSSQTNPVNALDIFAFWSQTHKSAVDVLPYLFETLKRATQLGVHSEVSGSLIRINHERGQLDEQRYPRVIVAPKDAENDNFLVLDDAGIWLRMLKGSLIIEK